MGLAVGSPEPLSYSEAEVVTSSLPSGLCCHDYLSPARPPLLPPKPLLPASILPCCHPLADGTPSRPSAKTGPLVPFSMKGSEQKPACVLRAHSPP